jgi:hypothetical protein
MRDEKFLIVSRTATDGETQWLVDAAAGTITAMLTNLLGLGAQARAGAARQETAGVS